MEFYSSLKKNEIMKFIGKLIDKKTIILREITQTQKNKHTCSLTSVVPNSRSSDVRAEPRITAETRKVKRNRDIREKDL